MLHKLRRVVALTWAVGKTTQPAPDDATLNNLLTLTELAEAKAQESIDVLSAWYESIRSREA
jgi:hypothetical protein